MMGLCSCRGPHRHKSFGKDGAVDWESSYGGVEGGVEGWFGGSRATCSKGVVVRILCVGWEGNGVAFVLILFDELSQGKEVILHLKE